MKPKKWDAMIEVECVAKKWGNSLGVVLPRQLVIQEHIHPEEQVMIAIKRRPKAKEFFGLAKGWEIDAQKAKEESRKGWHD